MRRRLIEALTYPRMLIMAQMDTSECPMHQNFNPADRACQICRQDEECQWLNHLDDFNMLVEQPLDALFEAFEFSTEYLLRHITRENHNPQRCACETCAWIRAARRLAREYRGKMIDLATVQK